ncbi:penicillin acylase family protein [Rheinheimera gaetbuli]
MFEKHPILTRFSLFLLLPVLLVGYLTFANLYKSVPAYSGEFVLQGLQFPVEVTFDQQGTPSVFAKTDRDAYFAQGFLHASERIWQMELQRRTVQGRLSEILGSASFATDLWMRTLDLHGSAEKAWDHIGTSAQQSLLAYAEGVNAWLNSSKELPPEFSVLGIKPEPWNVVDSLAWQKVLALNLGLNMYGEMHRLSVLKVVPPEHLQTFFEHDPPLTFKDRILYGLPLFSQPNHFAATESAEMESRYVDEQELAGNGALLYKDWFTMARDLRNNLAIGELYSGSNAWAVAGKHTKSGGPILANDPHLGVQQNALWYGIQMKGERLNVTGMSIVGIPGVAIGRNTHIAWGTTSLMSDQQDLFFIDVPLDDNSTYLTDQGSETIELKQDVIAIRSDIPEVFNKKINPVVIEIRKTSIGPIVSDAVRAPGHTVVLSWPALDSDDRSFEAFHQLQYATDWSSFRTAVSLLKAPGLHFVYADSNGNIGSQVGGHMPIRGKGVGVLPLNGSISDNLWQGYVPFEKLPYTYNPDSGVVVSANNKIVTVDNVVISHDWASMARNTRIHELIEEFIKIGEPMTLHDMGRIQDDLVDLNARFFLPLLLREELKTKIVATAKNDEKEKVLDALATLSDWDAIFSIDSSAASIYEYWLRNLRMQLFSKKLNPAWNNSLVSNDVIENVSVGSLIDIFRQPNSFWCKKAETSTIPCESALISSFYEAISGLEKDTGSGSVSDWHWGGLHQLELSHQVFSSNRLLQKLVTSSYPMGGSINTINIAIWQRRPAGNYRKALGASVRHIFDMGPNIAQKSGMQSQNAYVLPTGQSAHFLSKHYSDQTELYLKGETNYYLPLEINSSGSIVQDSSVHLTSRIVLIPGGLH